MKRLDAKFALEERIANVDLAAIEAKSRREDKKSRARTLAIQSATVAIVPCTQADKEEEPIGEVFLAALLVASHYPGLPTAEIF